MGAPAPGISGTSCVVSSAADASSSAIGRSRPLQRGRPELSWGVPSCRTGPGRNDACAAWQPTTKLVIYTVLDNNGSGEDSWSVKAIDHIFDTNERAGRIVIPGVNLSLGGEFDVEAFNCGHTPLRVESRRLWRHGVVVLAAGNESFASLSASNGDAIQANMGMSLGDPAHLEEAIVVGSVYKNRPHAYGASLFFSRGPAADGRMKPDYVAPGERIFSVRNDAPIRAGATFDDFYTEMSGTSMAAPHVSGLLAAFLSKRHEFIGDPEPGQTDPAQSLHGPAAPAKHAGSGHAEPDQNARERPEHNCGRNANSCSARRGPLGPPSKIVRSLRWCGGNLLRRDRG